MRAEDTIQFMFDFFTDFSTRKSVLDHLFCVYGNGFKWVNGELVCSDDRMDKYQLKKPVEYAQPSSLNIGLANDIKTYENIYRRVLKKQNKSDDEIQKIIDKKYPPFKFMTPSKKHSYIYNYPDDVKDDWLALINETKKYLREEGYDIE